MIDESIKEKCIRLEHFETPKWAAKAILEKEKFVYTLHGKERELNILDPCCGTNILARAAKEQGYKTVCAMDIHLWHLQMIQKDFLALEKIQLSNGGAPDFGVFMNPPFSKACEFVEQSFKLGARKILCFQRFAWWESRARKAFWEKYPPTKVYICGDRAPCWRHDIPQEERKSSSPTAHAWFVFERGHKGGTLLDHIWKGEVT